MNVAIIGASEKEDRYSYKAMKLLIEYNHSPILINPVKDEINGIKCYKSLNLVKETIDVITVYVGPDKLEKEIENIKNIDPKIVILNPGTTNENIINLFEQNKIKYIEACTLVLLRTNQFNRLF